MEAIPPSAQAPQVRHDNEIVLSIFINGTFTITVSLFCHLFRAFWVFRARWSS